MAKGGGGGGGEGEGEDGEEWEGVMGEVKANISHSEIREAAEL